MRNRNQKLQRKNTLELITISCGYNLLTINYTLLITSELTINYTSLIFYLSVPIRSCLTLKEKVFS